MKKWSELTIGDNPIEISKSELINAFLNLGEDKINNELKKY